MKCKICNFENKSYQLFCEQCGATLGNIDRISEIKKVNALILDNNLKISFDDSEDIIIKKLYSLFNIIGEDLANFSISTIGSIIALLTDTYNESEMCVEMFYKISVLLKNEIPSNPKMYKFWLDLAIRNEFKFALVEHMENHIFGRNGMNKDLDEALSISYKIINRNDATLRDLFIHLVLVDKNNMPILDKKAALSAILEKDLSNIEPYQRLFINKIKLDCIKENIGRYDAIEVKNDINEIFKNKTVIDINDDTLVDTIKSLVELDKVGLIRIHKKEGLKYFELMKNKSLDNYELDDIRTLNYLINEVIKDKKLFKEFNDETSKISSLNFKNTAKAY